MRLCLKPKIPNREVNKASPQNDIVGMLAGTDVALKRTLSNNACPPPRAPNKLNTIKLPLRESPAVGV